MSYISAETNKVSLDNELEKCCFLHNKLADEKTQEECTNSDMTARSID